MDLIKKLLTPISLPFSKFRIGTNADGGYVFAKELLDSNDVYSYGIGGDPEGIEFDLYMANLEKKVYQYDASVSNPPVFHKNFIFKSEHLNKNNFISHIIDNNHLNRTNLIAQIDIEGSEFSVFEKCDNHIFNCFSQMSIEFHDLCSENLWSQPPLINFKENTSRKADIISRILNYFYVFHIHGNNHSYIVDGLPNVMEVTFINKKFCNIEKIEYSSEKYPTKYDRPCNPNRYDYILNWWQ